jgi:hypothetical protein
MRNKMKKGSFLRSLAVISVSAIIAGAALSMDSNAAGTPKIITYTNLRTIAYTRKNKDSFPSEIRSQYNGLYVKLTGAIMPVEDVPADGKLRSFWLVTPRLLTSGCIFCNPGALYEMVLVETDPKHDGIKVNREKIYSDIVSITVTGNLYLGPSETPTGMMYLFKIIR